jgi:phosphoribosyl 1,2-cyclic phosphate phosphodiesterase
MEATFLGTGAAQGNPAAYCRCPSCQDVRKRGGRDLRSRSAMRLGDHHQIDAGPDTYLQMVRHGLDMYDVEHILVTHTHSDHLCLSAIADKVMSTETNQKPLVTYMSRPAKDLVERAIRSSGSGTDWTHRKADFRLVELDYFASYSAGDLEFDTVKASHNADGEDEFAINYLITFPGGRRLLYAVDTGYYMDETWEFLQGKKVDTVVMDSTFGGRTDRDEYSFGHLHVPSFLKMLERMSSIGFIDASAGIYATHFNPHQGLDHEGLQNAYDASDFRVIVAYDGLTIPL